MEQIFFQEKLRKRAPINQKLNVLTLFIKEYYDANYPIEINKLINKYTRQMTWNCLNPMTMSPQSQLDFIYRKRA